MGLRIKKPPGWWISYFAVAVIADRSNLKEKGFLSAHGSGDTAHHDRKAQKRGLEGSQDS